LKDLDYAVVGAGIHGTKIAADLVKNTELDQNSLSVFDPEGYGRVFDRRTDQCNTEELRSPFVHNVGPSPYSLESYAKSENRASELVSGHEDNPPRPTTELFMDHLDYVVESNELEDALVPEYVRNIDSGDECVVLETNNGVYAADNVLLAIGYGRPNVPEFAADYNDSRNVSHVFEPDFSLEEVAESGRDSVVVGGSITAAQAADYLARNTEEETYMVSRSPIQIELVEADPTWLGSREVEQNIHTIESTDERVDEIRDIRNDGSMPKYVWDNIDECLENEDLNIVHDEVAEIEETRNNIGLETKKGLKFDGVDVLLATGFEDVAQNELVREVQENLDLQISEEYGYPVLNDSNLRWLREDGFESSISVTGKLTEPSLGPFAGNIYGSRVASDKIVQDFKSSNQKLPLIKN